MTEDTERFETIEDIFERMSHDARRHHVSPGTLDVQTKDGLHRAQSLPQRCIPQRWRMQNAE